jgi:hypothetical protein
VATILLDGLHRLGTRVKTSEAEEGLRIKSSCYFYLFRTDQEFGYVVFVWTPAREDWAAGDGGACPFDTGGLWHDRMVTDPVLRTGDEKRAFFARHDCPLDSCASRFSSYLERNYVGTEEAYIDGHPPAEGVAEIFKAPPNNARSWTWEVRIRRDRLPGGIELERITWNEEQVRSFVDWIRNDSRFDLATKRKLQSIVKTTSLSSAPGTGAAQIAAEHLKTRIKNKA